MALVHEVSAEVQDVVTEWLGKFAVAWPYHAHATMVRSGSTAIVREFSEALSTFSPLTIRNAAIDLRNTGEHFPSPAEWRRQCAQTAMRRTVAAVVDETVPAWMRARIALQDRRCAVLVDAVGAAAAPPREQHALLKAIVARLLQRWEHGDEGERVLYAAVTRYEPLEDEDAVLAEWARWAVSTIAHEAAQERAQRRAAHRTSQV